MCKEMSKNLLFLPDFISNQYVKGRFEAISVQLSAFRFFSVHRLTKLNRFSFQSKIIQNEPKISLSKNKRGLSKY